MGNLLHLVGRDPLLGSLSSALSSALIAGAVALP
jgi:hypothetical protein